MMNLSNVTKYMAKLLQINIIIIIIIIIIKIMIRIIVIVIAKIKVRINNTWQIKNIWYRINEQQQ